MNKAEMSVTCEVALIKSQDLNEGEAALLRNAHQAALNAYAPYSGFHVGAAVRLKSGTVVLGNNQENIAYPSGLCGERVAVFSAGAQFPEDDIESIAIVSPSPLAVPDTFMPCGSCRQVLREAELRQKTPIKIYLQARDEFVMVSKSASNLLPFSFTIQNGVFK